MQAQQGRSSPAQATNGRETLAGIRVIELADEQAEYCGLTLAGLGADVIKADPTAEVSEYHKVIEAAGGIPVLVRGGGRVSDREILERTHALIQQGASGIVYGRNVIQHPNPKGIVAALMALVHDDASVDSAEALL